MEIIKMNSPNFNVGRNGWVPDMIVYHISDGYETGVQWLCNLIANASAHFFVTKTGKIYQLVAIENVAWANGNTINPASDKRHYSKATNSLVRNRKTSANFYTISIETEGFYHDTKGELTQPQLEATEWLTGYIIDYVKEIYGKEIPANRTHLVGHYEINPITKPNCPGEKFPFKTIIDSLKKSEEDEEVAKRYNKIDELPYGKDTVTKMIRKGFLAGVDAEGNLDITLDMLRVFVTNDKAGVYGN